MSASVGVGVCRTKLIEDTPERGDLLAPHGELGPHERVARALAELITSDDSGGKVIGLEGGWGSGKTTVIKILEKNLEAHPSITIFPFDAWAHQGDPLRRTYLESFIRHLQGKETWIDREKWEAKLALLAKRRRVERSRTVPETTPLGLYTAIAALLVPVGALLTTKLWPDSMKIDMRLTVDWPLLSLLIFSGMLTCAPLWVVGIRAVQLWNRRRLARERGEFPVAQPDDWAFLKGSIETKTNEVTESPEPTSIEFEDLFQELMKEALKPEKNRAVLVLDNLDRTNRKDALEIWSTLQTFLRIRSDSSEDWFCKLSIIVPYDPKGLRKLWAERNGNSESAANPGSAPADHDDDVWRSFTDKSFHLRFEVPPPLLSQWKDYLSEMIGIALPDHPKSDQTLIFRVFNLVAVGQEEDPTPRELKVFVNQIGAIHRQWQDDIAIGHVAYYVASRRHSSQDKFRKDLVQGNLLKFEEAQALFDSREDLTANLAAMLFNASPTVSKQLLLGGPIYDSLVGNKPAEIERLERLHGSGFWAVLEQVSSNRLPDVGLPDLGKVSRCLESSRILREPERSEGAAIKRAIRTAVLRAKQSADLDEEEAEGICAILRVAHDPVVSSAIYHLIQKRIATKSLSAADRNGVLGFGRVCDELEAIGHASNIEPFEISPGGRQWIELAPTIRGLDPRWSRLIKTTTPVSDIETSLISLATEGQFPSLDFVEIIDPLVRARYGPQDWTALIQQMRALLSAGQPTDPAAVSAVLRALWALRKSGSALAAEALETASDSGDLLYWLGVHELDEHSGSWVLFTYLERHPDAPTPPPNPPQLRIGHRNLLKILDEEDRALVDAVHDVVRETGEHLFFLKLADARRYDPFTTRCLRIAAERSAEVFMPANDFLARWVPLKEHLGDGLYGSALARLLSHGSLEQAIRDQSTFEVANAELYRDICNMSTSKGLLMWFKGGLAKLDKDAWMAELNEPGPILRLALKLGGDNGFLRSPYRDALVEWAEEISSGRVAPDSEPSEARSEIFDLLDPDFRGDLPKRLLAAAASQNGDCADDFFTVFGDEIGSVATLRSMPSIVFDLFSPLLEQRRGGGLRWLRTTLKKYPDLLERGFDRESVRAFRARIADERANTTSDEAHIVGVEIADLIGVSEE